jgi:hypothetical protein
MDVNVYHDKHAMELPSHIATTKSIYYLHLSHLWANFYVVWKLPPIKLKSFYTKSVVITYTQTILGPHIKSKPVKMSLKIYSLLPTIKNGIEGVLNVYFYELAA